MQRARIAIADRQPDVRWVLGQYLKEYGHMVPEEAEARSDRELESLMGSLLTQTLHADVFIIGEMSDSNYDNFRKAHYVVTTLRQANVFEHELAIVQLTSVKDSEGNTGANAILHKFALYEAPQLIAAL